MSNTITKPTVGRIVHVFLDPDAREHSSSVEVATLRENSAPFVPAIINQVFDNSNLKCNMVAFPVGRTPLQLWSVAHESTNTSADYFWRWPEQVK